LSVGGQQRSTSAAQHAILVRLVTRNRMALEISTLSAAFGDSATVRHPGTQNAPSILARQCEQR